MRTEDSEDEGASELSDTQRLAQLETELAAAQAENVRLRKIVEVRMKRSARVGRMYAGRRLSRASTTLKKELASWSQGGRAALPYDEIVDFGEASIRRWVRVGTFGFMAAMIPTMAIIVQTTLMSRQNKMIGEQNDLFSKQNVMITLQSDLMGEQNDRLARQNELMASQNGQFVDQNSLMTKDFQAARERWAATQKVELLNVLYNGTGRACTSGSRNRQRGGVPQQCHPSAALREREQAVQLYIDLEREWPSLGDGAKVGLAFLNLQDAYLPGIDLRDVDLYGALFFNTKLPDADLAGAGFHNGILDSVDFRGANLRSADFRGALLSDSSFQDADLTGARVLAAETDRGFQVFTELDGVDWTGATCPDGFVVADEDGTCEGHFLASKPDPEPEPEPDSD